MEIAIIGAGYVGLVTAACLAEAGNRVVCIDENVTRIAMTRNGQLPFYEPQLAGMVAQQGSSGALTFTDDVRGGTQRADIVFLAVGTPPASCGRADVSNVLSCAAQLADVMDHACLLVVKSTVPVGTCENIQDLLEARATFHGEPGRITVASNPEFLAEGSAIRDFKSPSRIVIGAPTEHAASLLRILYAPFDPDGDRLIEMDVRSAEFSKYASNAMLAARVSLINELAVIAERLGVDIEDVCRVMKTDPRIGSRYLQPGAGYGGSCLPKDLRALIAMAQDCGEEAPLLRSVDTVNRRQADLLVETVVQHFEGSLEGTSVAIWGLAFKPETDDIREAPSVVLIERLLALGAVVRAYDPAAMPAVSRRIASPALCLADSARHACEGADALVVMTPWAEFEFPDFGWLARTLKTKAVFDARHLYRAGMLEQFGLRHYRLQQGARPILTSASAQE
ncbi:MAG TPA: UDP-glucose/GDP-mannose dehydrogenase family protein [Candidimonas sp.]|nr:UDP-glucose/GDP-mannose dehydrogenase family protein [Candidimonas sp.]